MSQPVEYSVHPAVKHARGIIQNLPKTTGQPLSYWCKLLQQRGTDGDQEQRKWLKEQHGIGSTTARLIAEHSRGEGQADSDPKAYLAAAEKLVEAMYSGKKQALRPIHDRLIEISQSLPQVRICPCKTIVPLYREHVFAEIKPATLKRVDLGLALKGCDQEHPEHLIDTGGLARKDRITHRFALESVDQIDEQIARWLKIAWELDH